MMKRVCVFCGSSPGQKREYAIAARDFGRALAQRGLGLVYGGAKVGMMGILASAALEAGGEVTGVMPKALVDKEIAFRELSDLRIVGSMHERKALMAELSDGFVALPGGLGTIEEFFEVVTWAQLGMHGKPCGLLNAGGYFGPLVLFLDHAVAEGFISPGSRSLVQVDAAPGGLIDRLEAYRPVASDKASWALRLAERDGGR